MQTGNVLSLRRAKLVTGSNTFPGAGRRNMGAYKVIILSLVCRTTKNDVIEVTGGTEPCCSQG